MKINTVVISLFLLAPAAYSQPIEKYVLDGKTYYGQPPAGLSLDVEVEDIRQKNTNVDKEGHKRKIDHKVNENAAYDKEVKDKAAKESD